MTIDYLVEYINKEKTLRGVCFQDDPRQAPINKMYYLQDKYLNRPLWGISSDSMQVVGIIVIESCRTEFTTLGEVSHYRWKVSEFHPITQFLSPYKRPTKAPTCSFSYPNIITEEFFHRISTFKKFLT